MSASSEFPIDTAQIVALFMECILYGIFLVTFGLCVRVLLFLPDPLQLKTSRSINWIMLVVTFAMGAIATLDVAFGLRHNLDAFIYYHGPGGATAELSNISYWVNVMKTLDYVLQTAIGDGILIYRCWVVWNRNWNIITPFIMMYTACLACGLYTVYIEWTLNASALLNATQLAPFIDSTLALTLNVNVLATSLIVWRIWRVRAQNAEVLYRSSQLARTIRIVVDSGLMYTASVIIFLVIYTVGSNAQYGVPDCILQVIGIAFNLIIIRVDQGRAYGSVVQHSRFEDAIKHSTNIIPMRFMNIDIGTRTFSQSGMDVEGCIVADSISDGHGDRKTVKTDERVEPQEVVR